MSPEMDHSADPLDPSESSPLPTSATTPLRDRRRSSAVLRAEFEAATSPHDWLRTEVARFLYPDLSIEEAFTGALDHLTVATDDLDKLSRLQFQPGDLVGFELRLGTSPDVRRAMFKSLPTPAALLLLCCDLAVVGEEVLVQHYIAHKDVVSMRAIWPFSMDIAVALVSPSPTELAPTAPKRRRWFNR
jgi:hypothetical protein